MKIAGIILIVFSGAGLGICKSLELSRREKILEQLGKMILLLKNQIRCTGDTIPDALLEVAGKMSGEYREFLLSTSGAVQKRNGNTFGEIFKDCARELLPLSKVSEEERGCFLSIGERLGYLDPGNAGGTAFPPGSRYGQMSWLSSQNHEGEKEALSEYGDYGRNFPCHIDVVMAKPGRKGENLGGQYYF